MQLNNLTWEENEINIAKKFYLPQEMDEKVPNSDLGIDEFLERKKLENQVLKKILKLLEEEKIKTESEVRTKKNQSK